MSYEFNQRVLAYVARHLPHARSIRGRFLAAHTEYPDVLRAQMPVRTDGNLSHIREISRLSESAAEAQHLQAFTHRHRHPAALPHHIGAATVREFASARQTIASRCPARTEALLSTQLSREVQPI